VGSVIAELIFLFELYASSTYLEPLKAPRVLKQAGDFQVQLQVGQSAFVARLPQKLRAGLYPESLSRVERLSSREGLHMLVVF
jgi:hypothetical protein